MSDIEFLPRRLATWGPVRKLMERIARAAGLITGDEELTIFDTPTGLSIQSTAPAGDLPTDPFQCRIADGALVIQPGTVRIQGSHSYDVAGVTLPVVPGTLACVRIQIELTVAGMALAPRHSSGLVWTTEVILTADPDAGTISVEDIRNSQYVLPGSVSAGVAYIPVACITTGGQVVQWWHGLLGIDVGLYHDHIIVSRID